MFELSIAFKYLAPRWRQLSVSIISLISILVIALVVWLIVVFFSVTNGLERNWIDRLIALTAPVRIVPTDAYYNSYYYQIDSISSASGYSHKSIGEKRVASKIDPYDPLFDEEVPAGWAKPDRDATGQLKDPVKAAFAAIKTIGDIPELTARDYEMSMANLKLQLLRHVDGVPSVSTLSQATYLGSFDPENKALHGAMLSKNSIAQMNSPPDPIQGHPILLPRGFRDAGVLVGDRGSLAYALPTASGLQEQNLPVFVNGFYDPGIIPIGGKFVIVNQDVTSIIRSAFAQDDLVQGNGINVRFSNLDHADRVKKSLEEQFVAAGIAPYWKVETFREFDFTRDVIQQLRSEKTLFTLLAVIIIVVACSNIVSMLIILVNDKKLEIGILRSMGATSGSIALIFGTCGILMGAIGSAIGILAALFTLRHLQTLVSFISKIQGHDLFNPIYYGETLPTELSWESISFVIVSTAVISLISGLVPAIKASMMRPSAILRAE